MVGSGQIDWDGFDEEAYDAWFSRLSPDEQERERAAAEAELQKWTERDGWFESYIRAHRRAVLDYLGRHNVLIAMRLEVARSQVDRLRNLDAPEDDEIRDVARVDMATTHLVVLAGVVQAFAILDGFLEESFGALVMSKQYAGWHTDASRIRSSLELNVYREMVEATSEAVRRFRNASKRQRIREYGLMLGEPINMDPNLVRAWQFQARVRNAAAHLGDVRFMPGSLVQVTRQNEVVLMDERSLDAALAVTFRVFNEFRQQIDELVGVKDEEMDEAIAESLAADEGADWFAAPPGFSGARA